MRNLILSPRRSGNEIDSFLNSFFGNSGFDKLSNSEKSDFEPRVNVQDVADKLILTFEIPGLEKSEIKILVQDDILTVSGERKISNEYKDDQVIRSEIRTGSFSRSFTLPGNVDATKVVAGYNNGLLNVSIPKTEESKPKEIEVNIA